MRQVCCESGALGMGRPLASRAPLDAAGGAFRALSPEPLVALLAAEILAAFGAPWRVWTILFLLAGVLALARGR